LHLHQPLFVSIPACDDLGIVVVVVVVVVVVCGARSQESGYSTAMVQDKTRRRTHWADTLTLLLINWSDNIIGYDNI
jgi:hypothetical protein